MVCVSGYSGVGKDEFCSRLVKSHAAVQTGLADPAKRHLADVYGFTELQLFGPSVHRNSGDLRYMKNEGLEFGLSPWVGELPSRLDGLYGSLSSDVRWWSYLSARGTQNIPSDCPYLPTRGVDEEIVFVKEGDPRFWLSPREALQKHCGLLNDLYLHTWVRKGIEVHKSLATGLFEYTRMEGLVRSSKTKAPEGLVTCFSDFRHRHEIRAARCASDSLTIPVLVRIRSARVPNPPFQHRSELEQSTIPDSEFDVVIHNDGTIQDLHEAADQIIFKHFNQS